MSRSTLFLTLGALLASVSAQTYIQTDLWQGDTFFDNFYFFDDSDPNSGFVAYQSQANATALGLISTTATSAKFGVDSVNVVSEDAQGRASVRIQSYQSFTEGLFVADIAHMPGDACGIWPAFWTLGSGTWPQNGEIDIIEGVNLNQNNQYTLHSGDGTCNITGGDETGTLIFDDCTATDDGEIVNTAGCSIQAQTPNNYGDSFNSNKGGTYVMQWTDSFIKIWFFPRGQEPATLSSPSPDVSKFGTPDANFAGCDIGSHFADNSIIFSTDFCGDWAANQAVYQSQCPITVEDEPAWESCVAQVANNPGAYSEGYWEVNFIKIFAEGPAISPSSSSSWSSAPPPTSSNQAPPSSSPAPSSSSLAPSSSSSSPASSSSRLSPSSSWSIGPPSSSNTPSTSSSPVSSSSSSVAPVSSSSSSTPGPSSSSSHYSAPSSGHAMSPPASSSTPVSESVVYTTVVTTIYTDVCPTGYTTATLTTTVTYCPKCTASLSFTKTVKPCPSGCGPSPTSVTVTVPCTESAASAPSSSSSSPIGTSLSPVSSSSPAAPVKSTPVAPVSYTGKTIPTPCPESQYTSPGYKGYPTTPQSVASSSSAAAAKVTASYGAGNGTEQASGTGAAKGSPSMVAVNGSGRTNNGILALFGAVVYAVIAAWI